MVLIQTWLYNLSCLLEGKRGITMRRFLILLVIVLVLLACVPPAIAQNLIRVYYAGIEGGVQTALALSDSVEIVTQIEQADVIVLNGVIPSPADIVARVQEGTGLVLILGSDLSANDLGALFGAQVTIEEHTDPLSLIGMQGADDPALTEIVWTSAPQIRERLALSSALLEPLVVGFEDGSLVLGKMQVGNGHVFVLTPYLDDRNPQFQGWAYFNYLIYHLVSRAAGQMPLSFADYAASPVPHARERLVLFVALGGLLVLAALSFWAVRRYSLAHPEALDRLVVDTGRFEAQEAHTDWEDIGYHRPLGGFLLALMTGLVLFVPLIIYQNLILPVSILPSAQALGIWGRVTQFFNLLWALFDMGTNAAFIKFMAQYRVHDPRQGIKYGQVFVWWQALSGAVQVAMVTAIASTLLPRTTYALYAWSVIVHSLIQIPGFYQVMRHALMGFQRLDRAQTLELALQLIFPIITQPVLVTLMVMWGRAHPVFGGPMGGLLGMGLAAYASEVLTFLLGLWMYRRLGYNARVLFLAHFDWATVRSAFRFGVFEMLGSVMWGLGQAGEILITQLRLVNYAEIWGNWGLAQNFVFAFNVLQTLYNGLMPSISEAISHARKILSQYYSALAYKWGGLISAFIGSVLLAVADRFILGASGPEFVRAAAYSFPLIIWGAIQYPSWVGDNIQLGTNRPYLKSALIAGEQVVRLVLAFFLLERFQINALIIAYFVGLLTKGIVAYLINHRVCYPQRFYVWQSLAAPVLAGAAHYGVLRWFTGLLWQGDQITSVVIFFIGITLSFPLFTFFYGIFGGWDDDQLSELRRAVTLSSFVKPLSWLFWASTAVGAHISPLHGRFPIDIRQAALAEAQSLTKEKVSLVKAD
jgi:O-antigen/teichoic acid export membrane protein